MCSDDTEHTAMVLQSLLEARGDVEVFRQRFARRLKWWFAGIPAGIGMATIRSSLKLWFGVDPRKSGVDSAGNGPAMRSAIIGAFYADDPEKRRAFVEASTVMTHSDSRAMTGALAIAELAAGSTLDVKLVLPMLCELDAKDKEWKQLLEQIGQFLAQGAEVGEFAKAIGCKDGGVSSYVYETVPVAIYSWLRHCGDGEKAVSAVLDCGGDADTVGAITGALCGASSGAESFPSDWIYGILEWPRGMRFLKKLAKEPEKMPKVFWGFLLVRNLLFLVIVLTHGFLRYLPSGLRLIR